MFGKFMNNYYYGKSGKGDFRKEDMPETRWQLFFDTLKTRLSGLCRLNLMYAVIWLPLMIVLMINLTTIFSNLNMISFIKQNNYAAYVQQMQDSESEVSITEEEYNELAQADTDVSGYLDSSIMKILLWLIPCIAITGPFTAGVSYVTRNWSRDEHAFIWSDFIDAVKANWKQGLVVSSITSVIPIITYIGFKTYGQMAQTQILLMVPQMLILVLAIIWFISVTYMHPIEVTYDLKIKGVLKNGLLLGIARLPLSVAIRLLHCVPVVIGGLLCWFWNPIYGLLFLGAYYFLIGFSLSRFVTASYTNAVFDKYINSHIEGAKVNQGLKEPEDDDDDPDETIDSVE